MQWPRARCWPTLRLTRSTANYLRLSAEFWPAFWCPSAKPCRSGQRWPSSRPARKRRRRFALLHSFLSELGVGWGDAHVPGSNFHLTMTASVPSPRGLSVREVLPLGRVRKVMAQTMRDSVQRAALSQITREMDLTAVQAVRRALASSVSLNVFLLAAVARTLPHHPLLNAELVDEKVRGCEPVNLGMAVAVPDGLIVAVIREAHRKTLAE